MSESMAKMINKANNNHEIYTYSEQLANTNDYKSSSDIFTQCKHTINPLLESSHLLRAELAAAAAAAAVTC